jgi:hypothetical protein
MPSNWIALTLLMIGGASGGAFAEGIQRSAASLSHDAKARLVHPDDAGHRHCGGACLKSGSLSWYCTPTQICALDCNSSPPAMHCHDP